MTNCTLLKTQLSRWSWSPSVVLSQQMHPPGATTVEEIQFALEQRNSKAKQQHGFEQFNRLHPCKKQLSCLKMFRQWEEEHKDDEQVRGDHPRGDGHLATHLRSLNLYFYFGRILYPWSAHSGGSGWIVHKVQKLCISSISEKKRFRQDEQLDAIQQGWTDDAANRPLVATCVLKISGTE